MRSLIVNADDFGISASANAAIIQAHREGILTSASLMMNESGFEEAVSLAHQNPRLGVGLHLTLLDGHATLPHSEIPALVNVRREFRSCPIQAGCSYFINPAARKQLRAEINAQFDTFQHTGLELDHVNSHHHLHAHPSVFPLVLAASQSRGFSCIRVPRDSISLHRRLKIPCRLLAVVYVLFHQAMARRAQAAGINHTRYVFGLLQTGCVDERYLSRLLPALPDGVSEVYSHPSTTTFRHELNALVSPAIRELVERLGIRLIRYRDIGGVGLPALT